MIKNYKVITLCSSTKFKDDFLRIQKEITLQGNVVLVPYCYEYCDNVIVDSEAKETLIDVHKRMINLSDEVFIINKNGYVGSSTKDLIEYAKNINKKIRYMENVD